MCGPLTIAHNIMRFFLRMRDLSTCALIIEIGQTRYHVLGYYRLLSLVVDLFEFSGSFMLSLVVIFY